MKESDSGNHPFTFEFCIVASDKRRKLSVLQQTYRCGVFVHTDSKIREASKVKNLVVR